jgi:hypothetical protein
MTAFQTGAAHFSARADFLFHIAPTPLPRALVALPQRLKGAGASSSFSAEAYKAYGFILEEPGQFSRYSDGLRAGRPVFDSRKE